MKTTATASADREVFSIITQITVWFGKFLSPLYVSLSHLVTWVQPGAWYPDVGGAGRHSRVS